MRSLNCFARLTIKTRILVGFGLVLLILIGVGISSTLNKYRLGKNLSTIVHEVNPATATAGRLADHLKTAVPDLGFYMLSGETHYKTSYENELVAALQLLRQLESSSFVRSSERALTIISAIRADIDALKGLEESAFKIAEHPEQNMPGLRFRNRIVAPVHTQMTQSLNLLISLFFSQPTLSTELSQVQEIKAAWFQIRLQEAQYIAERDTEIVKAIYSDLDFARRSINRLLDKKTSLQPTAANNVDQLAELAHTYHNYLETLTTLHQSEKWRRDTYMIRKRLGPLYESINDKLANLINLHLEYSRSTGMQLLSRTEQSLMFELILMVAGIVVGVVIASLIGSSIIRRLHDTVTAMTNIADGSGQLDQQLDESGVDDLAVLAGGFNRFVTKIRGVVNLVISSSKSLADEADHMATLTVKTQENAAEQQRQITEVACAIDDVSRSMVEINANALAATEAAREAQYNADNGTGVVASTVSAIHELASDIENVSRIIESLAEESRSIESILSIIKGISEQTNLLALNAAIEAARAGEVGRGFAVVAEEVRTLSVRIHTETDTIQSKISKLQSEATQAVSAMKKEKDTAHQTVEAATHAGTALESIKQSVETITTVTHKIAGAIEDQNNNTGLINRNVSTIQEFAIEAADGALLASRTSHELSMMAEQLQGLVAQFLLEQEAPAGTKALETEADVELF